VMILIFFSNPPASNPALRSRDFPPAPVFSNPHAIREGVLRGRRGKPSWADGWDPMNHEYAITASEGSGGRSLNILRHTFFVVFTKLGFVRLGTPSTNEMCPFPVPILPILHLSLGL
jgi:hypothetical protein